MMRRWVIEFAVILVLFGTGRAQSSVITFNDAINGAASYDFDSDGDQVVDVKFSTTDPQGFNTMGPGPNMSYIDEPGLEGTTLLSPDLRVDFLSGASQNLRFSFALSVAQGGAAGIDGVTFKVFDAANNLLDSTYQVADFTLPNGVTYSSFPEAQVLSTFSGLAAYATFDFDGGQAPRYIIDNFEGNFGSSEDKPLVPEPSTLVIWSLLGGIGITIARVRNRKAA